MVLRAHVDGDYLVAGGFQGLGEVDDAHVGVPVGFEMVVLLGQVADQSDVCLVCTDIFKMAADSVARHRESPLGGISHACEYETALMLHFQTRVDMESARDEPVLSPSRFVSDDMCGPASKVFWSTWRYQKSVTGTYGCPTLASAEKGAAIFRETVEWYVELLREVHAAP